MAEERVYTINLRDAHAVPRIQRARKAIILIRRYLERHMKGDVLLGTALNEEVWAKGIKKPPVRVKVKAVKDGNIIRAELLGAEEQKPRATASTKKGKAKETKTEIPKTEAPKESENKAEAPKQTETPAKKEAKKQ